jgi:hypothetical protein
MVPLTVECPFALAFNDSVVDVRDKGVIDVQRNGSMSIFDTSDNIRNFQKIYYIHPSTYYNYLKIIVLVMKKVPWISNPERQFVMFDFRVDGLPKKRH